MGVRPGDRVASYLPNIPQTVIAMLAATSIGAIWTSVSPDFGWRGVLGRFRQLTPKVLFCVDGYGLTTPRWSSTQPGWRRTTTCVRTGTGA
jgi:acetoacetyl-CoA synthetase